MNEEIQVTVSSYGPGRKYLMMRYTDPITGKPVDVQAFLPTHLDAAMR